MLSDTEKNIGNLHLITNWRQSKTLIAIVCSAEVNKQSFLVKEYETGTIFAVKFLNFKADI